jgi:hypothetical protein
LGRKHSLKKPPVNAFLVGISEPTRPSQNHQLAVQILKSVDSFSESPHTLRVTILLVCADELRMNRLKDAIHSAGFRLISAKAVDEAWAKSDFFEFAAVVIDHELKNDIAAAAFRTRFITLDLHQDCSPDALGLELSDIFNRGSELVQ